MNLRESSVLVTGGASGLGLATARGLAGEVKHLVLVDLPGSGGPEMAADLGAEFHAADVTSPDEMRAAVSAASALAPLRAVVHCAGRGGPMRILDRDDQPGSLDHFAELVRVNLTGTFNVLRLAAAAMATNEPVEGERGVIVLTASIAAFEGQVGQVCYASSKAGVHGMTLAAARDLSSRGIRVNAIAPGVVETPMLGRLGDEVKASLGASVPYPRRLGRPEEFAALAGHIVANGYLNGETIRLDGALRMAPR